MVVSSAGFNRVVEYVLQHSSLSDTISIEGVVDAYKRLIDDYYDAVSLS